MMNKLKNCTSPYLLQHANNPVHWFPWGDEALAKAKAENKLIIISIGYSACHWCHVMEHESFEDEAVADIMNAHFVSIKIDREERPDIDMLYMSAVQILTGRGGWPLNVIALPDGRPLWGGTYFPQKQWKDALLQLSEYYKRDEKQCLQYASELSSAVTKMNELVRIDYDSELSPEVLHKSYSVWERQFDNVYGGPDKAPKFALPCSYNYLLQYSLAFDNNACREHVLLTLNKMAAGGIYDHLGGGFARYSTDIFWKVPHFEKMLYDNAQLVSLYCKAFMVTKELQLLHVAEDIIRFVMRELRANKEGYFAALDADTEGAEGKYYVWQEEELKELCGDKYDMVREYYQVGGLGHWEHGNNILIPVASINDFAAQKNADAAAYKSMISTINEKLLARRESRVRPGLDDKQILAWNAMMISAFVDAYMASGNLSYYLLAESGAAFIEKELAQGDGRYYHQYTKGVAAINAFHDDYAFYAKACLDLFTAHYNFSFLEKCVSLIEYGIEQFFDVETNSFYFTPLSENILFSKKPEMQDNVIPASNSVMAQVIFQCGLITGNAQWIDLSKRMLLNVQPEIEKWGSAYSNWCSLQLMLTQPYYVLVVCGENANEKAELLRKSTTYKAIVIAATEQHDFPFLEDKLFAPDAWIYPCTKQACMHPVASVDEVLLLLKQDNASSS
ncbi:MAG: thioredoxin domain-containing protein [Bacteroidetes bacterium]|nr:thioredoxin domain-containing protein [Bacteroidota bacterium]